jgi:hypothetical protein
MLPGALEKTRAEDAPTLLFYANFAEKKERSTCRLRLTETDGLPVHKKLSISDEAFDEA